MTQPTCDRYYLTVPSLGCVHAPDAATDACEDDITAADLAVFRACLLYIAGDLRHLAGSAPTDRREQLIALSALVASIAER